MTAYTSFTNFDNLRPAQWRILNSLFMTTIYPAATTLLVDQDAGTDDLLRLERHRLIEAQTNGTRRPVRLAERNDPTAGLAHIRIRLTPRGRSRVCDNLINNVVYMLGQWPNGQTATTVCKETEADIDHLKVAEDIGLIEVTDPPGCVLAEFRTVPPQTTIRLTAKGYAYCPR